MARRNKYVDEAKELSDQGKIAEAVPLLKKAQEIIQTDKIARRIKRMEVYLFSVLGIAGDQRFVENDRTAV